MCSGMLAMSAAEISFVSSSKVGRASGEGTASAAGATASAGEVAASTGGAGVGAVDLKRIEEIEEMAAAGIALLLHRSPRRSGLAFAVRHRERILDD